MLLGANTVSEISNKNNGLGIDNLAAGDHGGDLLQACLDHFDVFTFLGQTASLGNLVRGRIGAGMIEAMDRECCRSSQFPRSSTSRPKRSTRKSMKSRTFTDRCLVGG
jgi:hypothetical protein